jgi:hypothetical protein
MGREIESRQGIQRVVALKNVIRLSEIRVAKKWLHIVTKLYSIWQDFGQTFWHTLCRNIAKILLS